MDPSNVEKLLNSFNADPIKLQERKTPSSAAVDSTYVRPIYVPKLKEKSTDELLEINPEEETINQPESEIVEIKQLPDKYSGLQGFYDAMNESDIKSEEAKYAILAQMGLESGWGKKSAGSKYHNYGNITTGSSWKGDWFRGNDTNAKGDPIKQKFRKYNSPKEFFNDYMKLIENLYPKAYEQLTSETFDIDKFSYGLRHGTVGMYAESPTYEDALSRIYSSVRSSMTKPEKAPTMKKGGILYNY